MDPNRALMEILSGLQELHDGEAGEHERDEVVDVLRGLADWLEKGGFVPNVGALLDIQRDSRRG